MIGRTNVSGGGGGSKSITVYSAANDTVYYVKNGVNIPLCTTDLTGKAENVLVPKSGVYTVYSSVADDPSNLTQKYSQNVDFANITSSLYLMKWGENTLYWAGNMCGFSWYASNATYDNSHVYDRQQPQITYNTNSMVITESTTFNSQEQAEGTVTIDHQFTKNGYANVKCVASATNDNTSSQYGSIWLRTTSIKPVTDTNKYEDYHISAKNIIDKATSSVSKTLFSASLLSLSVTDTFYVNINPLAFRSASGSNRDQTYVLTIYAMGLE